MGCCGNKATAGTEYQVTALMTDGTQSTFTFASSSQMRAEMAAKTGVQRYTFRLVPKK